MNRPDSEHEAAREAAQNVVDSVTSWEYSAEEGEIAHRLDDGLAQAGVRVDDQEKARLVEGIDAAKDESHGAPSVGDSAEPTS